MEVEKRWTLDHISIQSKKGIVRLLTLLGNKNHHYVREFDKFLTCYKHYTKIIIFFHFRVKLSKDHELVKLPLHLDGDFFFLLFTHFLLLILSYYIFTFR